MKVIDGVWQFSDDESEGLYVIWLGLEQGL
jgi:hypothetical protein